jgi:hypothetical protein
LTKQPAGHVVGWTLKVWMVEDVEELAPETKLHPLLEAKLPLKRDIGLCGSETAQHIASEVPLLSGGWLSER